MNQLFGTCQAMLHTLRECFYIKFSRQTERFRNTSKKYKMQIHLELDEQMSVLIYSKSDFFLVRVYILCPTKRF